MNKLYISILAFVLPLSLFAQNPAPALPQSGPILILNAVAHIGNGQVIQNSAIGFENGKLILVADATRSSWIVRNTKLSLTVITNTSTRVSFVVTQLWDLPKLTLFAQQMIIMKSVK